MGKVFAFLNLLLLAGCQCHRPCDEKIVSGIIEERLQKKVGWYSKWGVPNWVEPTVTCLLSFPLDPESSVQIALLNNPEIQAAFEEIGIAYADLMESGIYPNPMLEGFVRLPDKRGFSKNFELSLTQRVIDLLLIPLRTRVAEAEFEKAQLNVAQKILDFTFDVQETYYQLAAEQKKFELLKKLADAADASSTLAKGQKKQGNINNLEFQTQMQFLLKAQLEQKRNQLEIVRLREKMNKMLGFFSNEACWKILPTLPCLPGSDPDCNSLECLALTNRLELQTARWELERLSRMGATKQWWAYTDLSLGISSEREVENVTVTGPVFGLSIPIFNYGQADRERLMALFRQSIELLHAKEIAVLTEVQTAFGELSINRELVTAYESKLLPLQQKSIQEGQTYYNSMAMGIYTLLQLKTEELNSELAKVNALKDYWLSYVALQRALGGCS